MSYVCIPSPHPMAEGGGIALSFGVKDLRDMAEMAGLDFSELNVREVLHNLGVDISKGVMTDYGEYRSLLSNKVEEGYIIRGYERSDEEWVGSSDCSDDNRILVRSKDDPSLRKELLDLSRVTCFTQLVMENSGE